MFKWLKRGIEADDYYRAVKKVYINGVIFHIKKISIDEHLAGLDVILKIWNVYSKEKAPPKTAVEDFKKIKKFCRDIIYAGTVKPELTLKKDETGKIHIDEILNNLEIAQKLTNEIIGYTYGKKK